MEPIEILERVIAGAGHLERGSLNLEAQIARLQRAIASLPGDIAARIPQPSRDTVAQITNVGSKLPAKLPAYEPVCFVPMTLKQAADEWRIIADGPGRDLTDSVSVIKMARGKGDWESAGAKAYGEFVMYNHEIASDLETILRSAVRAIDDAHDITHDWLNSVIVWLLGAIGTAVVSIGATIGLVTSFATWAEAAAAALGAGGAALGPAVAVGAMVEAGTVLLAAIGATALLYLALLSCLHELYKTLTQIAESAAKALLGPVYALSDTHPWYTPGNGVASPGSWQK